MFIAPAEQTMTKEYIKPNPEFQTQFDDQLPTELQRTACGITSLYSGLKALGVEGMDYPTFVRDYIGQTSFNVPYTSTEALVGGVPIEVPISYYPNGINDLGLSESSQTMQMLTNTTKEVKQKEAGKDFTPGFTFIHGFDHRGVKSFIDRKSLALSSELIESDNIEDILNKVERGNTVALLSAKHNDLGYPIHYRLISGGISTHVILVTAVERVGNETAVQFIDPAFMVGTDATQVRSIEALKAAYAGKGTLISRVS